MTNTKPTVLVTGVAGNLGLRLLPQLADFNVVGVDIAAPRGEAQLARFERVDMGEEASCRQLVSLLRETGATAVAHLAFVIDPVRTGVLDRGRMWQINVSGTARVMEAITEVNRSGGAVEKFVYPSSVSAYGSDLGRPATEESRLLADSLTYAVHKREADEVVQFRAASLGACSTYLLRPHIFVGASMQNYLVGALRGTPTGRGKMAERLRRKGTRLPLLMPRGHEYPMKLFQFVHVDDVARLMAYILRRPEPSPGKMTILNVAGRGQALTLARCAQIANQKIVRLPGKAVCSAALRVMWNLGISGVPPDALPYLIGSYTMDTSRLRAFLGKDYEDVIQYTIEDALKDSFVEPSAVSHQQSAEANVRG